jgi:hypothetical protein
MKIFLKNKHIAFVIILLLIQVSFVFNLSDSPRGSDQFWYIVDAESASNNIYTTNNVYPNSMPIGNVEPRPFVQNRPVVYFAGYLIKLGLNCVAAYKLINLFSYFVIISILFISLLKLKHSLKTSLTAICVFITSPLIIFSLYNPLTNLFDAALFSIFIYFIYIFFQRRFSLIFQFILLLFVVSCYFLLINQRQDFIIYLWSAILILTYYSIRSNSIPLWQVGIVYLLLISIQIGTIDIFTNHLGGVIPNNSVLLTNVKPYFGNMVSYFGNNSDFLELSLFDIFKAKISIFFMSLSGFFNILISIYLILIFTPLYFIRKKIIKLKIFETLFIVICLLNFTILFVFQFQYRYSIFLIAPSIFIVYNLLKEKNFFRFSKLLFPFFCFLFFCLNYFAFNKINNEAKISDKLLKQVTELNISSDSRAAVIYNGGSSLIWSWLLKDIKEVHYYLPNEIKDIPLNDYDIYVIEFSKSNKKKDVNEDFSYQKVGNYLVKLNSKE